MSLCIRFSFMYRDTSSVVSEQGRTRRDGQVSPWVVEGCRRTASMNALHKEQRRHVRYPVQYAGSFSGTGFTAKGMILNLSLAGCRALSETPVSAGELGILIEVPRHETPLRIARAAVRWSQGDEFGVEFLRLEPDQQRRLRELIQESEADQALRMWQRG